MKTINKFVDEISGREFETVEEAIKSEKKNGGIQKLFSFWKEHKVEWRETFQRTDVEYLRLKDALVKAITEYEPWIAKHYEKNGGLRREHIGGGYIIGRFLDDGDSELYKWYCIMSNVCPTCFLEHEQQYNTNHCEHSQKPNKTGSF